METETILETGEDNEEARVITTNHYLRKNIKNNPSATIEEEDDISIIATIPVDRLQFRGNKYDGSIFVN